MTDENKIGKAKQEALKEARENRRRIIRFVTVFVCIALTMLISYRYARHSRWNDRYLFEAARSTSWVLNIIGDSSIEPYTYGKMAPQRIRAEIHAWKNGREVTDADIAAAEATTLSAWERWSHRALKARLTPRRTENGPRVQFVLRHGLASQIMTLADQVNALESDPGLSDSKKKEQLAPLQKELRELRAKQRQLRTQKDDKEEDETRSFTFILVPECGAIEIMAIFLAAVVAFPTTWRKRLIGIAVGVPIMYGVNIFRLTVLAVIGALDQSQGRVWFSFAHEYVWQAVYIVFVVAVWLLWVEYVVKGKQT